MVQREYVQVLTLGTKLDFQEIRLPYEMSFETSLSELQPSAPPIQCLCTEKKKWSLDVFKFPLLAFLSGELLSCFLVFWTTTLLDTSEERSNKPLQYFEVLMTTLTVRLIAENFC